MILIDVARDREATAGFDVARRRGREHRPTGRRRRAGPRVVTWVDHRKLKLLHAAGGPGNVQPSVQDQPADRVDRAGERHMVKRQHAVVFSDARARASGLITGTRGAALPGQQL